MLVTVPAYLFSFVVASRFCVSYDAITQEQKCGSRKNHKDQRKCSHECYLQVPGAAGAPVVFLVKFFLKNEVI